MLQPLAVTCGRHSLQITLFSFPSDDLNPKHLQITEPVIFLYFTNSSFTRFANNYHKTHLCFPFHCVSMSGVLLAHCLLELNHQPGKKVVQLSLVNTLPLHTPATASKISMGPKSSTLGLFLHRPIQQRLTEDCIEGQELQDFQLHPQTVLVKNCHLRGQFNSEGSRNEDSAGIISLTLALWTTSIKIRGPEQEDQLSILTPEPQKPEYQLTGGTIESATRIQTKQIYNYLLCICFLHSSWPCIGSSISAEISWICWRLTDKWNGRESCCDIPIIPQVDTQHSWQTCQCKSCVNMFRCESRRDTPCMHAGLCVCVLVSDRHSPTAASNVFFQKVTNKQKQIN